MVEYWGYACKSWCGWWARCRPWQKWVVFARRKGEKQVILQLLCCLLKAECRNLFKPSVRLRNNPVLPLPCSAVFLKRKDDRWTSQHLKIFPRYQEACKDIPVISFGGLFSIRFVNIPWNLHVHPKHSYTSPETGKGERPKRLWTRTELQSGKRKDVLPFQSDRWQHASCLGSLKARRFIKGKKNR